MSVSDENCPAVANIYPKIGAHSPGKKKSTDILKEKDGAHLRGKNTSTDTVKEEESVPRPVAGED